MRGALAIVVLTLVATVATAEPLDQNGEAHAWKGDVGRLTVIDFAAAWCVPCWKALPRLQSFADEHPDINVIVVSVDDEKKGRDRLVEKLGLTVPVLWDEHDEIASHYRPTGMPSTFVVNAKGEVIHAHAGSSERDWNEMVAFIERKARE